MIWKGVSANTRAKKYEPGPYQPLPCSFNTIDLFPKNSSKKIHLQVKTKDKYKEKKKEEEEESLHFERKCDQSWKHCSKYNYHDTKEDCGNVVHWTFCFFQSFVRQTLKTKRIERVAYKVLILTLIKVKPFKLWISTEPRRGGQLEYLPTSGPNNQPMKQAIRMWDKSRVEVNIGSRTLSKKLRLKRRTKWVQFGYFGLPITSFKGLVRRENWLISGRVNRFVSTIWFKASDPCSPEAICKIKSAGLVYGGHGRPLESSWSSNWSAGPLKANCPLSKMKKLHWKQLMSG